MVKEIDSGEAGHVWPWPAEDVSAVTARARSLFRPPSGTWSTVDWIIREWLCDLASLGRMTPRVRNLAGHVKGMTDSDLTADILMAWLSAISLVAGRRPLWQRHTEPITQASAPPVPDLAAVSQVRRLAGTGQAKAIRERARITVAEMGLQLGVAASSVSRWEAGTSRPNTAVAERWYRILVDLMATVDIDAAA